MDLRDFSKLMGQRRKNLKVEVHKVVQDTAKAYLVSVSDLTPVDTGAALSNWQVGAGSAPSGEIKAHVPGNYRSTALENLGQTIQIGFLIIDGSAPGTEIHIVNNISYIRDLDDGTSRQAPAGMTSLARQVAIRVPMNAKVVFPR